MKVSPEQHLSVTVYYAHQVLRLVSLWMKSYSVTFQMKATEQYFSLIPFTYYALKGDSNSSVGGWVCDHIN